MALTKVGKEGVVGLDNSADATAITITSAEKVGIGISNPASYDDGGDKLVVGDTSGRSGITIVTGTSNDGSINFADGTSGTASYMGYINYHHNTNEMKLATNGSAKLTIDANGHVTMSSQPAFHANKNGTDQLDYALNSEVTVTLTHERFDQNGDFNTSNSTFTAPVTGKYFLNVMCRTDTMDTGANFYVLCIRTSNEDYRAIIDPNFSSDLSYFTERVSILADMDANDTAFIFITQSGGTQQADIDGNPEYTFFSGHLVC